MEGTATTTPKSPADRSPDVVGAPADLPAPSEVSKPPARAPEPRAEPESRPVRRWALVVLGICALLFFYHLFADRLTPFTTQASVNAFVVPVSPEVAGLVTEVNVVDNQKCTAPGFSDTRQRYAASWVVIVAAIQFRRVSAGLR